MQKKSEIGEANPGLPALEKAKKLAMTGTVVIAPVIVTLATTAWLLDLVGGIPGTGILELTPYTYLNQAIKLGSLLVAGVSVAAGVGRFTSTSYGIRVEKALDQAMNKVPVIGTVYSTAKVTTDTVVTGAGEFGRPVKIDMRGMKLTGFKTGNHTSDGKQLVFLPTSPNITSGFVLEIKEDVLQDTEETRTEAITKILSAGFGARADNGKLPAKQQQVRDL